MTSTPTDNARAAADRIIREFRPEGWPAKADEIARFLDRTFPSPDTHAAKVAIRYRDHLGQMKEARTADEVREAWSMITDHSRLWSSAKRFLFRIGLTDADGNVSAPTPQPAVSYFLPETPSEEIIRAVDKAAHERWPNARSMAIAMYQVIRDAAIRQTALLGTREAK